MNKYSDYVLKGIFRLLTLEELNELASTKKKYKMIPLTEIALSQLAGGELDLEKISDDFYHKSKKVDGEEVGTVAEKSQEVVESADVYQCAEDVAAVLEEYRYYCQEAEKKVFAPSARKKKRSRRIQMSKFILEGRKQLEEANFKLKRQEIVRLYRENAKINVKREKEGKGKCATFDLSGILIKKRV